MEENNTQFVRNPDFIHRKIVDEVVLVPIHKQVADMDSIFTLNEVGAFIWQLLDHPASKISLRAALLEEYEASPETLSADLDIFLEEMLSIGAIRRIN